MISTELFEFTNLEYKQIVLRFIYIYIYIFLLLWYELLLFFHDPSGDKSLCLVSPQCMQIECMTSRFCPRRNIRMHSRVNKPDY